MEYTKIKSAYILERVKNTSWEDHEKIDGLIRLYEYIISPPKNYTGGLQFTHLQHTYPDEYLKLLEEVSPEALKQEQARKAGAEEVMRKFREEEALKLELAKKDWLSCGGKP